MLIEFSIANYGLFKEKQTLSMVASTDNEHPENIFIPQTQKPVDYKLVKSVAIYGANASGKSQLCKAIRFMRDFILNSAVKIAPGEKIDFIPFKLNSKTEKQPGEFEIIFIFDGIRYQYGFIVDQQRIYEEWLYVYKTSKGQNWFYRVYDTDTQKYDYQFSKSLKGERRSLIEKTRDNALFLSLSAQFNHEQLLPIYMWFKKIRIIDANEENYPHETASLLEFNESSKNPILQLLKQADLNIEDIKIESFPIYQSYEIPGGTPSAITKKLHAREIEMQPLQFYEFIFIHLQKDSDQKISFKQDEESYGTIRFLSLLGPFIKSLSQGNILIIDEISASLHSLLIRHLVQLYGKSNKKNAQLIFTTHDTTQLDHSLFRRDQIWFTEKISEGASNLYPLTSYKPRKEESLQRGYLAGRYGATPFIPEGFYFDGQENQRPEKKRHKTSKTD